MRIYGIHIATTIKQHLHDFRVATKRCPVQGNVMLNVPQQGIGAILQQVACDIDVAVLARPHKRSPAAVVHAINERATILGGGQQVLAGC